MSNIPAGQERKVEFLGGASIDGTPVAYIVVLAAVVAALAFIPFSVVMASGGSFPMSQGVFSLVGWVLGPIAGAVASGIGTLIGVFIAPHTAGVAPVSVYGAIVASFAAGCMVTGDKRRGWWLIPGILAILSSLYYAGRALFINGVSPLWVLLGYLVAWVGILLYLLPTRILFAKWIASKNAGLVALGAFLGTFASFAVSHVAQTAITYHMFNWPEEVWQLLAGLIPIEYLSRCLIGAVIGAGVIVGLRAIGLVKPAHATY
jgi:hypothetical protein